MKSFVNCMSNYISVKNGNPIDNLVNPVASWEKQATKEKVVSFMKKQGKQLIENKSLAGTDGQVKRVYVAIRYLGRLESQ